MITINAAKLKGSTIKLSERVTKPDAVRVTGLKPGQTLIVDLTIDGSYQYPDEPKEAGWVSPDGTREGVHTALLTIAKGNGFTVKFTDGARLINSRGRGVTITECSDFTADDIWVQGCRTAGIAVQDCQRFTLNRPVTVDTSNYQTERTDVEQWNVAGSITTKNCTDGVINYPISCDHMGNGLTATESTNGQWTNVTMIGVNGATVYVNASPNHVITDSLVVGNGTSTAYVINSEEENEGASADTKFVRCRAFNSGWGLGVWGNEKKGIVDIGSVTFADGLTIATDKGAKIHKSNKLSTFDDAGTLWEATKSVDKAKLAKLQQLGDALANYIRNYKANKEAEIKRHEALSQNTAPIYTWDAIMQQRALLVAELEMMRGVVPDPVDPPDPVEPPDDGMAELRAQVATLEQAQATLRNDLAIVVASHEQLANAYQALALKVDSAVGVREEWAAWRERVKQAVG